MNGVSKRGNDHGYAICEVMGFRRADQSAFEMAGPPGKCQSETRESGHMSSSTVYSLFTLRRARSLFLE